MNLLDFELFIFDFDGTIMDTEKYHCKAWNKALSEYKKENIILEFTDYQKHFHNLDPNYIKNHINYYYQIDSYDKLYKLKQKYYQEYIENNNIEFIEGAEEFIRYLLLENKKIIIVTNTSINFINIYKKKYNILNHIDEIYTKEHFINRKPHPECYLKIANKYNNLKKIGFEDSIVGLEALYQVKDIFPIIINDENYYYNDIINSNYNVIKSNNFNIVELNNELNKNVDLFIDNLEVDFSLTEDLFIDRILNNNIDQLKNNFDNIKNAIFKISSLINKDSTIYLSGMGKSGYVCKKCASTWQSLSLKCSYIDLPNLPHGDFGIFRDKDILILISNSGNTDEIIYILEYINKNLNKKITTISIIANKNSKMELLSDYSFVLENIKESDNINMTPSTSSLIFMSLLDGIAINLRRDITKDEFKIYHPSGSLGKR